MPVKEFRILTPEEFDRLHAALGSPAAQLLVETAVESGLRWGELIELRLRDVHQLNGIVTVTRSVAEVQPQFGTNGELFIVKPYPKGRRSRRFRLHPRLVVAMMAYAEARGKELDDLLFNYDDVASRPAGPPLAGRGARRTARCADQADRRVPPPRLVPPSAVVPACRAAGIDPPIRLHDLRHSHASWLLAVGADLQVVKERLGHRSIATTDKYLHTLPDADETALPRSTGSDPSNGRSDVRRLPTPHPRARLDKCWQLVITWAELDVLIDNGQVIESHDLGEAWLKEIRLLLE